MIYGQHVDVMINVKEHDIKSHFQGVQACSDVYPSSLLVDFIDFERFKLPFQLLLIKSHWENCKKIFTATTNRENQTEPWPILHPQPSFK